MACPGARYIAMELVEGKYGTLADLEREAISRTLAEVEGNRRRAAERLGIPLRTLYETLKRYRLG